MLACCKSFVLLTLLSALVEWSCTASARDATLPELKRQLATIEQQIHSIRGDQDELLRQNSLLTRKITRTKQQLQSNTNPLRERQLRRDLTASRTLADRIQGLDQRIYSLTRKSVALRRQLIDLLDTTITERSQQVNTAQDSRQKRRILERVLALQQEKESYQAQIAVESRELVLSLNITLQENDGPNEIGWKIAIVQDQQDILQTKLRKVRQQIEESQKKLALLQNMLELLRDMRRGEDDEFDLDRGVRIAELEGDISDVETTLEILQARKEDWQQRVSVLIQMFALLSQEITRLTQPVQKGDSGDNQ